MSRLIDANALLEAIDPMYKSKKDIVPDTFAEGCVQMEKLINQQPTAYDVEAVLHELSLNIEDCTTTNTIFNTHIYVRFSKAVNIIKRGGIDEAY